MQSSIRIFLLILAGLLPAPALFAHGGELLLTPEAVAQGEPFMVTLAGIDIRDVKKLTWDARRIPVFLYKSKLTALVGVDLLARAGKHTLKLTTLDLDEVAATVTVRKRPKITAPLGIPDKLGGNTRVAQNRLVTTLVEDNAILAKIITTPVPAWSGAFRFPLRNIEIIDAYGYSRNTGSYSIPHKGTDFRAATRTDVLAINDGIVRLAREFTVYGKTVAIDHGGGVVSLSMHLSKIQVKEGQKIKRGDKVGFSGDTGYALGPHLHLSVRIHGVSVDPIKFFALFR